MSRQLGLGPDFGTAPEIYADARERLVDCIRDVCEYHGHKVVAAALGRKRAAVSQAVAPDPLRRNGHRFYIDDLPWLVDAAPNADLVDVLAELRRDPASVEDQLAALLGALDEVLAPGAKKTLLEGARIRLARNRSSR